MSGIEAKSSHGFSSDGREGINVTGVSDVVSFDDKGVVLETVCGSMAIEGESLHITTLNISDGRVVVEGRINGVYYFENKPQQKRGLFGRRND
ncbi:MAG: sporulation protein [Clostridia bacterium]|nr:sporulation protein [Clostridia bacterium]